MSIKIPKIYENEEKKDFEYPDLINYDDIRYTPNSLEDINKEEGDQFDQNITDIAGNTIDISTNAGGIAINVADILGNTSNIVINASGISANVSDIAGNTSDIVINAGGISANVSDISGNTSNISINATNINLKVSKDSVVAQINLSTEGIEIEGKYIELDGNTSVLGSFSVSGDIISGGTITGVVFQTSASGQRVELGSSRVEYYDSSGTLVGYMRGDTNEIFINGSSDVLVNAGSGDKIALAINADTQILITATQIVLGDTLETESVFPGTTNTYNLGGSSYNYDNLFINDIYYGSTWIIDFKTNGAPLFKTNIYIASGKQISGNIIPTADSNFNIGTDTLRYAKVYADQFPASPIKVAKSGMETFRKIGKIKKSGENYTLETDVLPEEFKIADEKGVQHTELKRTIGITVQTVGELIEKTDDLEAKVNQLINK